MTEPLKMEASYENIDVYDERALMIHALDADKYRAYCMPEVTLVQRILKLPQLFRKPSAAKIRV